MRGMTVLHRGLNRLVLRRVAVSAAALALGAGVSIIPAVSASASPASTGTILYAYPNGTGSTVGTSGCTQTTVSTDDCSLTTALGVASGAETGGPFTIYLEATGEVTSFTDGPYYDSADWAVTIEPMPGLVGNSVLDGSLFVDSVPILTDESSNYSLTLSNLTFQNGFAESGAALDILGGTVSINSSTFQDNEAVNDGGAIDNGDQTTGALTITDSTFTDNTAYDGGAIDNGDNGGSSSLTITNTDFTDNTAYDGGAIDNAEGSGEVDPTLSVTGGTFENNSSTDDGGAIDNADYNGDGSATISGVTFNHNYTAGDGGAIDNGDWSGSGTATITSSSFDGNSANFDGGAIDNGDNDGTGTLAVTSTSFSGNSSSNDGGAIDNGDNFGDGTAMITGSTLTDNSTVYDGGAIDSADNAGTGSLSVTTSELDNNDTTVGDGGAIDNGDGPNSDEGGSGSLTVTDSTISDNTADNCGGGIDNGDSGYGTLTVEYSTIAGNVATTGTGGDIDTSDGGGGDAVIIRSTIAEAVPEEETVTPQDDNGIDPDSAINDGNGNTYLAGTVITGSTSPVCIESADGGFFSEGYNLEESSDGSCNLTASTDLNGESAQLGSLANNGGTTLTELPSSGSPLVAAIPTGTTVSADESNYSLCSSPDVDQRVIDLPVGASCTIGAVDLSGLPNPVQDLVVGASGSTLVGSWQPPNGGWPATGYICTLLYGYGNPSTFTVTVSVPTQTCSFTGLSGAANDGISVVAFNADGDSTPVAGFPTSSGSSPGSSTNGSTTTTTPVTTTTTPSTPPPHLNVSVYFATDKYVLTAQDKAKLDSLASEVTAYGVTHLTVTGYCDRRGGEALNTPLSLERATATASYLRGQLVDEGDTSVGFTISGRGILRTFANLALDRVAKVTN